MGIYKTKFNPFSKSLQWVLKGTLITFKEGVDTYNDLPVTGNSQNEARIINDIGHLYVWSIEESSGELSDWVDQGDVIDIQWESIDGKPSSDVANIDDAVTKKHEQNTDTKLDEGGANEVSAEELRRNINNTMILAFYRSVDNSKTKFQLDNEYMDEFEDENGIDTVNSVNQVYYSDDDYYRPDRGDSTKLLLHFNGNDGDTSTNDDSGSEHTINFNENAQLDTSIKKFGSASYEGDGNGDYLTISSDSDFDLDSEYTIDFWVYFDSFANTPSPFSRIIDGNDRHALQIDSSDIHYSLVTNGVTHVDKIIPHSMNTGEWHHLAFIRGWNGNENSVAVCIDGIQTGSIATFNGTYTDYIADFMIGAWSPGGSQSLDGRIDEFRIVKGEAKWTANFTPPIIEHAIQTVNMTLISDTEINADIAPVQARIVLFEEDESEILINTDIKAYVTRDGGINWIETVLVDDGKFQSDIRILSSLVDLSSTPSDTDIDWKVTTHNNKDLKIRAVGLSWQ